MELQIENLKALIKGVELNNYQRALALQEWSNLLGYVKDLEQLNTPVVVGRSEQLKPLDADMQQALNELTESKVGNEPTKKRF